MNRGQCKGRRTSQCFADTVTEINAKTIINTLVKLMAEAPGDALAYMLTNVESGTLSDKHYDVKAGAFIDVLADTLEERKAEK